MDVKPGYKQTEVGVIPEDWEVKPLVEIFSFGGGLSASRAQLSQTGHCYLHYGDIHTSPKSFVDVEAQRADLPKLNVRLADVSTKSLLLDGDVVFVDASEDDEGTSKHQVVRNPRNIPFISGLHTIVAKSKRDDLVNGYKCHCFHTRSIKKQFLFYSVGTKVSGISKTNIGKILLPIPPPAEQEAIAEALSDADALIESLEHILAKRRQLKQGTMQELLIGKKRLPGFGGEWEVKPLGDLFNFSGGFTASRDQLSSEGYCYLHYGDIHTSKTSFVDVRSEYQDIPKLDIPLKKVSLVSLLDDGDVVFVDASEDDEGTSKHVVISNPDGIPFISGLHTIVAKCKTNTVEHQYRRYCFQTSAVKAQFRFFAVGTKVSGISKTNIARITLLVPSCPEQAAIAAILSHIDAEIAALEAKLAKTRQLKQGMMQELLTGRIRLI